MMIVRSSSEIVIQQIAIEFLAENDVEAERRLVEHQQAGVNRRYDREVQLRDHALGKFTNFRLHVNVGLTEQLLGPRPRKTRVDVLEEIQQLGHADPARQYRDVGDETDVLHELLALAKRVQAENGERALAIRKPQHCFEQRGLAGAIRADETHDPTLFDIETDVIYGTNGSKALGYVTGTDKTAHSSSPFSDADAASISPSSSPALNPSRSMVATTAGHSFSMNFWRSSFRSFLRAPSVDEHAATALLLYQVLVDELLVALQNRQWIQPVFGSNIAYAGQRVTVLENTLENHGNDTIPQLPVDRLIFIPFWIHRVSDPSHFLL